MNFGTGFRYSVPVQVPGSCYRLLMTVTIAVVVVSISYDSQFLTTEYYLFFCYQFVLYLCMFYRCGSWLKTR